MNGLTMSKKLNVCLVNIIKMTLKRNVSVSKKQNLIHSLCNSILSEIDISTDMESFIKAKGIYYCLNAIIADYIFKKSNQYQNEGIKNQLFKNLFISQILKKTRLLQIDHFKTEGRKNYSYLTFT